MQGTRYLVPGTRVPGTRVVPVPGMESECLQVAVILLLCVQMLTILIPETDKYFTTRQPLRNQSMQLVTARAGGPHKNDWTKFDKFR